MGTHPIFESDFDCLTEKMKFSLALLASAAVMAEESPEQARLVVSKKTETKILAQNQDLTFSYKIYNIGKDAAVDVKMTDSNFDSEDDFQIVSGSASGEWARIEPDGSITHDITVKPLKSGQQNITSATLTYKTGEASDPITLYSSDYGVAQFIEESEYLRKHASHLQDWAVFLLLSVPSLVFPYLLYNKSKSKYEKKKSA